MSVLTGSASGALSSTTSMRWRQLLSRVGRASASKDQAAARKFPVYLLDKPAQTIIAASDGDESPFGSGVNTAQPPRLLSEPRPSTLTVADLGDGKVILEMPQQAGLL